MRITGGGLKGRILNLPKVEIKGFRPTMDFLREVIFSSVTNYIDLADKRVLDLYSGSGIFSFECISRGAALAMAIEKNRTCCEVIKSNAEKLGVLSQIHIQQIEVEKLEVSTKAYDVVFADPPYESVCFLELYHSLKARNLFSPDAFFIFEERGKVIKNILEDFSGHLDTSLVLLKSKIHGDSGIVICRVNK